MKLNYASGSYLIPPGGKFGTWWKIRTHSNRGSALNDGGGTNRLRVCCQGIRWARTSVRAAGTSVRKVNLGASSLQRSHAA